MKLPQLARWTPSPTRKKKEKRKMISPVVTIFLWHISFYTISSLYTVVHNLANTTHTTVLLHGFVSILYRNSRKAKQIKTCWWQTASAMFLVCQINRSGAVDCINYVHNFFQTVDCINDVPSLSVQQLKNWRLYQRCSWHVKWTVQTFLIPKLLDQHFRNSTNTGVATGYWTVQYYVASFYQLYSI